MLRTILKMVLLLGILSATTVCAVPPPLPDFVIESISVYPEQAAEGTPVSVTVVVKNQGEVVGDGRYLDVWHNPTRDLHVLGDVGDWWAPVGPLDAGESRTITSPETFFSVDGTNQLLACIEFEDLVSEKSNTNNCEWVTYETVSAESLLRPVHRFWSHQFGSHFYIIGDSERDRIAAKYPGIWNYEDLAWYAYPVRVSGTEPVHRFWSDILGKHFYIIGDSERDRIADKYRGVWNYEAVAWYAYPEEVSGTDPVGRFWSDQFMGHFYIITQPEINRIAAKYPGVWNYEAVAYWAFTSLPGMAGSKNDVSAHAVDVAVIAAKGARSQDQKSIVSDVALSDQDGSSSSFFDGFPSLDVVYLLAVPDSRVAAYIYNSATEQWTCVLPATNSPASVVLENVQPDCRYLFDVSVSDSDDGEMVSVHQSAFEYQFDPPETIHEDSDPVAQDDSGVVGSPIARIKAPVVDGPLTVKLYSSSQGVVKTLKDVSGGETVELSIPEWNRWYWVGGWSDADNELVLSIWLRQERVE